jgi:hypothetical protein
MTSAMTAGHKPAASDDTGAAAAAVVGDVNIYANSNSSAARKAANKQVKKAWSSWAEKVRPLLGVTGRSTKPEFDILVALLQESFAIPEILANPGTADYRLFEAMVLLKASLLEQVKNVSVWVARSHGLLSGSSHTRAIGPSQDAAPLIEQHIVRGKALRVQLPGVDALQHSADAIRAWQKRARGVIDGTNTDQDCKPTASYVAGLIQEAACLPHDPVELTMLQRLLEEARGLSAHIHRIYPHVSWSPLARLGFSGVARKQAAVEVSRHSAVRVLPVFHSEQNRMIFLVLYFRQYRTYPTLVSDLFFSLFLSIHPHITRVRTCTHDLSPTSRAHTRLGIRKF